MRVPGWLRKPPRWRFYPRVRFSRALVRRGGFAGVLGWSLFAMVVSGAWMFAFMVWAFEVMLWVDVWMLYGFYYLPARWVFRHNVIGRAVTSVGRPQPQMPDRQGYIDLARLGDDRAGPAPLDL